jgi:hypothetical protein
MFPAPPVCEYGLGINGSLAPRMRPMRDVDSSFPATHALIMTISSKLLSGEKPSLSTIKTDTMLGFWTRALVSFFVKVHHLSNTNITTGENTKYPKSTIFEMLPDVSTRHRVRPIPSSTPTRAPESPPPVVCGANHESSSDSESSLHLELTQCAMMRGRQPDSPETEEDDTRHGIAVSEAEDPASTALTASTRPPAEEPQHDAHGIEDPVVSGDGAVQSSGQQAVQDDMNRGATNPDLFSTQPLSHSPARSPADAPPNSLTPSTEGGSVGSPSFQPPDEHKAELCATGPSPDSGRNAQPTTIRDDEDETLECGSGNNYLDSCQQIPIIDAIRIYWIGIYDKDISIAKCLAVNRKICHTMSTTSRGARGPPDRKTLKYMFFSHDDQSLCINSKETLAMALCICQGKVPSDDGMSTVLAKDWDSPENPMCVGRSMGIATAVNPAQTTIHPTFRNPSMYVSSRTQTQTLHLQLPHPEMAFVMHTNDAQKHGRVMDTILPTPVPKHLLRPTSTANEYVRQFATNEHDISSDDCVQAVTAEACLQGPAAVYERYAPVERPLLTRKRHCTMDARSGQLNCVK